MIRQAMLAAAVAAALAGCSSAQAAQPVAHLETAPSNVATAPAADASAPEDTEKTPWEYDVKNPAAGDNVRAVVACLHRKGVKYVEPDDKPSGDRVTFSFGGPNNDRTSITRGLELTPQCEREVFAAQASGQAPAATSARSVAKIPAAPAGQGPSGLSPEQIITAQKEANAKKLKAAGSQEINDKAMTGQGPATDSSEDSDATPWEYNVKNPKSRDYVRAVVACLHRKGVKYVELDDKPSGDRVTFSLGGPNNDRTSITRGLDLAPQCEREALTTQK